MVAAAAAADDLLTARPSPMGPSPSHRPSKFGEGGKGRGRNKVVELVQANVVTKNLADQFWNLLSTHAEFTDVRIKVIKRQEPLESNHSVSPVPSPKAQIAIPRPVIDETTKPDTSESEEG